MVDLARLTKEEAYELGIVDGRAQVTAENLTRTGFRSTEFYLALSVTLFAIWAGYTTLNKAIDIDGELLTFVVGTVAGVPLWYLQSRSSLKKNISEKITLPRKPQ